MMFQKMTLEKIKKVELKDRFSIKTVLVKYFNNNPGGQYMDF